MWPLRKAWDVNPWTRVSFGTEWVLDPTGEYILAPGPHKHLADTPGELARMFQQGLEKALDRFARIRAHQRGSAEEQAEIELVMAEGKRETEVERACFIDGDLCTECTVGILGSDAQRFTQKLSNVFTWDEPEVRRKVVATLGRYADRHGESFRSSELAPVIAGHVKGLLDDPEESVRHAAAIALHQFAGQSTTGSEDVAELVSAARAL